MADWPLVFTGNRSDPDKPIDRGQVGDAIQAKDPKDRAWVGPARVAIDAALDANEALRVLKYRISELNDQVATLRAQKATALDALKITSGNILSLGPAGALGRSYRDWLRVVDGAITAAERV